MKYSRLAALMTAALCCLSLSGCGKNNKSAASSFDPASVGESGVGEVIVPPTEDEEASLGSYRYSSGGLKLYYSEEEYPTELILALEKLFSTYADRDFDTYTDCLYPSYAESMETFLQKDYQYDLNTSFTKRCDSLEEDMGGKYKLTRIKVEVPDEDYTEDFFNQLDDICGEDYKNKVTDEVDKLYNIRLFIMVQTEGSDTEQLFFKDTENGMGMVVAEKDGKYYAFC